jgi:hypothetical protein
VVPLNANVSFDALSIATSLPRIQGWLQRCLSDHPKCNSYSTAFLPSRILAIGGPESAKIFLIPSKKQAPYIALSYCWGKAQFLKLTTKNLQTCKDGILIDTLPNSFRHAIEVARGLNIHNIWIDALCILQDDLGDWEIEASKMAEVYRNSVLVLAMTKASSPDEDCRGKILNTEIDSINARLIHHFPDPGYETSSAFPLAQRGWAFQERLLAPRVLHFGPHELAWQCLTSTDCECGREGGLLPSNHAFNEAILKQSDTENIASLWRTLVAQYSALQFTFESDRLPALSGIVAVIQSARPGLYLAGLWSDTLIIDMLWYVDDDLREDPLPSPTPTTSPLSSPSWSWASVGAPVLYSVSNSSFYEMTLQCHIEGFHCEPAGVSMTGRIKSGWVRMNSSMIKCHRSTSSGNTPRVTHAGGRSPQGPKDAELEATFLLDKLPDNQKLDFFMVRMATWESSHYTEEQTLLIRPVDELESCFERIGIAIRGVSQPPLPWPQERRTITIV